MKLRAVINTSLILDAIQRKNLRGISDAAAHCGCSPAALNKLIHFEGELPRLDALFRICAGLEIDLKELVRNAPAPKAEREGVRRVLAGRW